MKPETPEQKERRRERQRKRAARKRAEMTPEQKRARYQENAAYQRRRREAMTLEERRTIRRQHWLKYHGESYRKKAAEYQRRKRAEDESYSIACRLRARIKTATRKRGAEKARGFYQLTGCTATQLREWIERQFVDGMSWENRSEWHIDHIIPCSAFNLADDAQQAVAFHYTNLRPLWKQDNLRKRATVPVKQRKLFWTLDDVAAARRSLA
jgi:hypothetical protein